MSLLPVETVLFFVLLQQSVSAYPTGSDQDSTPSALKQCHLNPTSVECRNVSIPELTSAPSKPTSAPSETWSQVPPIPSESNTASATALAASWSSADEASSDLSAETSSEPYSDAEIAQRSLSGRVLQFLYRVISQSDILNQIESAARRRKNDYWPVLIGMFTVGGTLLTAGMAALAAMSGKALMSSMLALGMSLMAALRPRRCRRSAVTGRSDCSSNYELIARPIVTHTHAHSAALQLDQPYPGYVRSFLDIPVDGSVSAATIAAEVPINDAGATWINYRVPDNVAGSSAWTPNVVGMRSPSRTINATTGLGSWGPGFPSTNPATPPDAPSSYGYSTQPRELTYSSSYSSIKTRHAE